MMQSEIITRFLESVGQKADVDLYLKLFRSQKKESFAVICPSARIVKTALDALHFDLRILNGLGLTPVVLLGVFEPRDADKQAARVQEWLLEDDVKAQTLPRRAAAVASDDRGRARDDAHEHHPARLAGGRARRDAGDPLRDAGRPGRHAGVAQDDLPDHPRGAGARGLAPDPRRQPQHRLRPPDDRQRAHPGARLAAAPLEGAAGPDAAPNDDDRGEPAAAAARAVHGERRRHA